MANEREFESFIEGKLEELGFNEIHYQGSKDKNIQSLLRSKSSNTKGKGKPEFIIMLNGIASDLVVVELKNDITKHCSKEMDNKIEFDKKDFEIISTKTAKDYSVDGVIHYMQSLIGHYNVIGLAISGDKSSFKLDTFQTLGDKIIKTGNKELLSRKGYLDILKAKEYKENQKAIEERINKELPILHNELRDKMKLSEQEKPLLISALLIAIQDDFFQTSYTKLNNKNRLAESAIDAIKNGLTDSKVPESKIDIMMTNFNFIKTNENVVNELKYILDKISFLFDGFDFSSSSYDIVGHFYNEFLKYTGGDKQGLGIVLTPQHITDLFCELVSLSVNDVVLDPCTGTGAFLISAMNHMIQKASSDSDTIADIKKNRLIGIEQNGHMFTLGCANMILRHDGKSNMFNGSCFDNSIIDKVKELKPTVCFINPPYAQKNENESELDFIHNSLNMLSTGGRLAAIVPISTAIEMSKNKIAKREKILESHRLDAVFSMPDELFYPVGVNSCIMLFTAHIKHDNSIPTYFGYWKNDGFVKTKINGRCDKYNKWQAIKEQWIKEYKGKKVIDGKSAFETVNHNDEWCAEAYMNVDYSTITEADFEQRIREYLAFQVKNNEYTVVLQNNPVSAPVSAPVVEEEKIGVFE